MDQLSKNIDEIKEDVKDIRRSVSDIDKTLAINTEQLKVHIKRTDLLENETRVIRDHVIFVNKLLTAIPLLTAVAALLYYITRLIG